MGKSTLVRQFARDHDLTLHEVNLERRLRLTDIFKTLDTVKILREIDFICGRGSVAGPGSLLFLDEIQAIPEAIQALRYFYEDHPDLPVIAAGSLIEFALSEQGFSMPLGRIEYLFLGPMTFQKTLAAMGETRLLDLLGNYTPADYFPEIAHEKLMDLQRIYLMVGGMPEAVAQFILDGDLNTVFDIHAAIVETYRDDFSKYARKADLLRLHKVFDLVPVVAGEKFKYARIDPLDTAKALGKALDLLTKAQVVMKAIHTDASGLPLHATLKPRVFKPFFLDVGLMNYICGVRHIPLADLKTKQFINAGKMAEQFIAQHLAYSGPGNTQPGLTYWLREGKSKNAEVDFIVQPGQEVVPVEVKAGKSGTLKSLLQFAHQKKIATAIRLDLNPPSAQHITHAIRQATTTAHDSLDLISLPLYLVEEIPRIFDTGPLPGLAAKQGFNMVHHNLAYFG